jgi:ferritin-like metal-binding protein YciE
MQSFEHVYMRTLRHLYDTEKQLLASLRALCAPSLDRRLVAALCTIEAQSKQQAARLEEVFRVLYQEPRSEASWVATALLREASEASATEGEGATAGCAAALLALKRYELTLYEALLRWSERCGLDEALPDIRRAIAEELLQAAILSEFAFETNSDGNWPAPKTEHRALH